ncbi:MAG: hypothetical protein ACI4WH_01610 [Oscillospiraceae bacterium]
MSVSVTNRIISFLIIFVIMFCNVMIFPIDVVSETVEFEQSNVEVTINPVGNNEVEIKMKSHIVHNVSEDILEIKPCDFILLFDQSKASQENRTKIIEGVQSIIDSLPNPSSDEHRVAIAGYGRINNSQEWDYSNLYNQNAYGQNFCYNTGYYTYDNQPWFHSWKYGGWSEGQSNEYPPILNESINSSYEDCFMSIDHAKKVIDDDVLVPWNAGASRTDVGFVLANELANLQQSHDSSRPLMVVFITSAPPIQNAGDVYTSRVEAVIKTANILKNVATIYGFGDYHPLNIEPNSEYDSADLFNETMSKVTSLDDNGLNRYYSTNKCNSLENSIKELLNGINEDITNAEPQTITLSTDSYSNPIDIETILKRYNLEYNQEGYNTATINYYKLQSYDDDNNPIFNDEPHTTLENQVISNDGKTLTYQGEVMPTISAEGYFNSGVIYGEEIEVIVKCHIKEGSLLIRKLVSNLPNGDDTFFRFHVVGYDIYEPSKKVYETWIKVSPNEVGLSLENLPIGYYTITELDTNGFDFDSYIVYQDLSHQVDISNSKDDKSVSITLDNISTNYMVIYNNIKVNDKEDNTFYFENVLSM